MREPLPLAVLMVVSSAMVAASVTVALKLEGRELLLIIV